jgi:hypothetical protein
MIPEQISEFRRLPHTRELRLTAKLPP